MKKSINNGIKTISYEGNGKFINFASAILAGQAIQFVAGLQGYLANLSVREERHKVELDIHFSDTTYPKIPATYQYSEKVISSHEYWSDIDNTLQKVRVATYIFKY